jgi:hypothetical protein
MPARTARPRRLYIGRFQHLSSLYAAIDIFIANPVTERRAMVNHHDQSSHKTEENIGQQIIFEFGICFATLLAIGVACELVFRFS